MRDRARLRWCRPSLLLPIVSVLLLPPLLGPEARAGAAPATTTMEAPLSCPPCDDGDACTVDVCDPGTLQCVFVAVSCDDHSSCTDDSCNPATGCQFQPRPDGEACDDGGACVSGEQCASGDCVGTPVNCDDGSGCTFDYCNVLDGQCLHDATNCNDGNFCTTDSCDPQTGQCVFAPQPLGTPCTVACMQDAVCVAAPQGAECVGTPTPGAACDDGLACTGGDICASSPGNEYPQCQGTYGTCNDGDACTGDFCGEAGACQNVPLYCDDRNVCTTEVCDPQLGCVSTPLPAGTACDDGNPCTTADACDAGPQGFQCIGTATPGATCDDSRPCTLGDQCVPDGRGGAYCSGSGLICDDGDPCTDGACDYATGQCVIGPLNCNDYNSCTTDICDPVGGCQHAPLADGTSCSDGSGCTTGDVCQSGYCAGSPVSCDDGNACTTDFCDGAGCVHQPAFCQDYNACTVDGCDPQFGCTFTPLAEGTACTDYNPCTTGSTCQAGSCTGTPVFCDDGNACTVDGCEPAFGGCYSFPQPDGAPCDDGALCTEGDACTGGVCDGTPVSCDDASPCTADSCDPATGACAFDPVPLNEVGPIAFTSATTVVWAPTPGATHWNVYRGTIPAQGLGTRPPGSVYDHACFESADASGDGATLATDSGAPPARTAYYYDVTEEGSCGEGPLGSSSAGATRPNLTPCPTPP